MNRYFTNITKHMNLKANKISHKSVHRIKLANFHSYSTLHFSKLTESEVRKEILNLSTKKATKNGDIPAKILKKSVDIYIKEITFIINDCLEKGIFPDDLKLADVHLYLKKKIVLKKKIIDRLAYYHTCQKSLKGFFINKLILL